MKLLGVEISNKISFEEHISTLGKKASNRNQQNTKGYRFQGRRNFVR